MQFESHFSACFIDYHCNYCLARGIESIGILLLSKMLPMFYHLNRDHTEKWTVFKAYVCSDI